MAESAKREEHTSQQGARSNMAECAHGTLVKVNQSGINDVDTDVSLYSCAACGKPFTITDF